MSTALIPISEVKVMAQAMASSNLFGVKDPTAALALMLVAQAEGRHPASAARDYHIISGRPALRSDAMLARFQAAGGSVEWHEHTDKAVSATFSHSTACPKGIRIDWTMERAAAAQLTGKSTWKQYPRQMLRARVISEGVRACYPAVLDGMYTPEEVQDMAPAAVTVREVPAPAIERAKLEELAALAAPEAPAKPSEEDSRMAQLRGKVRELYANLKTTTPKQQEWYQKIDSYSAKQLTAAINKLEDQLEGK